MNSQFQANRHNLLHDKFLRYAQRYGPSSVSKVRHCWQCLIIDEQYYHKYKCATQQQLIYIELPGSKNLSNRFLQVLFSAEIPIQGNTQCGEHKAKNGIHNMCFA
jgi:hypothetical protein